ncbi:MAG: Tyrosine-specific transport protein [Chlamydiia bacterium]|nr:Tyrosine-specific transport protein [Chlamydiia bacterium]
MEGTQSISKFRVFSGSLLVGGTALGAGMLALPLVTALGGFLPAIVIYLLCWLFSVGTGLLFLEIALSTPKDANIVTMAGEFLGKGGKFVAWALYLFLFYTLTVAYVSGGGGLVSSVFGLSPTLAIFAFVVFFGGIVYLGPKAVDPFMLALMVGLVLTYLAFVTLGFDHVSSFNLERSNFWAVFTGLPVIFTSFSYQGVIPTLMTHLHRNKRAMRVAIFGGTLIPFVAYVLWDFLIKGIIPLEGEYGLLSAATMQRTAVDPLSHFLPGAPITLIAQLFAFFALTTSFVGVTLGLIDFLADSLNVSHRGWNRFGLSAFVFLPPLAIALINPALFLSALRYAGGFGCAILLGLLPILMVWQGRYRRKNPIGNCQLPGGRPLLFVMLGFIALELIIEIFF